MTNTTPFNKDGSYKSTVFRDARDCLFTVRNRLLTFQKKFATHMRLESPATGAIREIELMIAVVDSLKLDQAEDAKLRKARDAKLLDAGFPVKQTPFEKMHKRHKAKRKGDG